MIVISVFFMIFVILGFIGIERKLQSKLKNDERIINRLDLILKEIKSTNKEE